MSMLKIGDVTVIKVVELDRSSFVVGAMLTTFGIFWGAEGMEVVWPLDATTLLIILAGVCATSYFAVRMLALIAPQGARVAARNI